MTAIDLMLLTGEYLLYLLAFILLVRPLVKQNKLFSPLFKYRKQMGWAFGALTALHVGIYLFLYIDNLSFVLTLFDELWFITGLLATVLTLALTATSNRWAQRKLKAKWKTLHKATYWIGYLGIIHGELASKQVNEMLYVMLIAYCLLLMYRFRNGAAITLLTLIIVSTMYIRYDRVTFKPQQDAIVEQDIQWQRCGQYGLDYWESSNGFYNCKKRN